MPDDQQEATVCESVRDMAQRHVDEGQGRIVRQEELIARLILDGHTNMLPKARELLRELMSVHALSEEHLARELAKASADTPG